MLKLEDKRLPPGWSYGLSPKQVKHLLREPKSDFRMAEFCGPRHPLQLPDETVLYLGELNCRVELQDNVVVKERDSLGESVDQYNSWWLPPVT